MKNKKIIIAIAAGILVISAICLYAMKNIKSNSKKVISVVNNQKDINKKGKEELSTQKKPTKKQPQEVEKQNNDKETYDFKTKYGILVKIKEQKVYVYENKQNVKTMLCSTGIEGKDTPVGNFKILRKQTKFYSEKYQQGGYFWLEFINGGNYLFHSVPFDKAGNIIKEEEQKLGQKASHGCIRVSVENSKWLYDNIPSGTQVIIK